MIRADGRDPKRHAARRAAATARRANLTRPLAGPPAQDPCPGLLNVTGPRDTMHTIYCREPYGHGDHDDVPMHIGSIEATDRFGAPVVATVVWYGR